MFGPTTGDRVRLADTETDNHFLPTVHLADGTPFLAFTTAHPNGLTASFTAGVKANGKADVVAAFSSRGPGGQFLKPDIAAPGNDVVAERDDFADIALTILHIHLVSMRGEEAQRERNCTKSSNKAGVKYSPVHTLHPHSFKIQSIMRYESLVL